MVAPADIEVRVWRMSVGGGVVSCHEDVVSYVIGVHTDRFPAIPMFASSA